MFGLAYVIVTESAAMAVRVGRAALVRSHYQVHTYRAFVCVYFFFVFCLF